uniref:Transaldolase n=2 Tax=Proboscia inermis TaxID=420281 RepID=A0A7S0C604_9STRA|mmetsp:Transcript_29220/g.29608  ORF Transcript_29220/g.29608 Transcript_29220/m.29608 type:complete len:114 (+) Transcript_29220:277-618(+)
MPASWRPSRPGNDLDEIRALSGVDRMTIPAPLLEQLLSSEEPLPRQLNPLDCESAEGIEALGTDGNPLDETEFRYLLNMDGCGTDKLGEGIRAFIGETIKLEDAILAKVRAAV